MEIERGGATVATVKKALITPLRDRFSIEVEGGEDMKGNVVDRGIPQDRTGRRESCRGVQALVPDPGHLRHRDRTDEEEALILAVVCIDQMTRA